MPLQKTGANQKPPTIQNGRAGTEAVELPKLFCRNVLLYLTVTLGGGGGLKTDVKANVSNRASTQYPLRQLTSGALIWTK